MQNHACGFNFCLFRILNAPQVVPPTANIHTQLSRGQLVLPPTTPPLASQGVPGSPGSPPGAAVARKGNNIINMKVKMPAVILWYDFDRCFLNIRVLILFGFYEF